MRKARQAVAAMRASVATNSATSAHFSDRVEKGHWRAPDVCDHHVRSRVMEPGHNRGALNMHVGFTMFPTDYSIPPHELAVAAEARGYESLWLPEHSHIPTSRKSPWPGGAELPKYYYDTYDPFLSLAAAAAVTKTIKLATGICLVVERDPIHTAKEVSTRATAGFRSAAARWIRSRCCRNSVKWQRTPAAIPRRSPSTSSGRPGTWRC